MMLQALMGATTIPAGYKFAALGTVTIGTRSTGTVTVTVTHGGRDDNLPGDYDQILGNPNATVHGLYTTQSTGAATQPRRTILNTNGDLFNGVSSTPLVSVNGSVWAPFPLQQEPPLGGGPFSDWYMCMDDPTFGDDPFGFWTMADGTVLTVMVVVPI